MRQKGEGVISWSRTWLVDSLTPSSTQRSVPWCTNRLYLVHLPQLFSEVFGGGKVTDIVAGNVSVVAVLLQLLSWAVAPMDLTVVPVTQHHQTTLSPSFSSHRVAVHPFNHKSCVAIQIHLNMYIFNTLECLQKDIFTSVDSCALYCVFHIHLDIKTCDFAN